MRTINFGRKIQKFFSFGLIVCLLNWQMSVAYGQTNFVSPTISASNSETISSSAEITKKETKFEKQISNLKSLANKNKDSKNNKIRREAETAIRKAELLQKFYDGIKALKLAKFAEYLEESESLRTVLSTAINNTQGTQDSIEALIKAGDDLQDSVDKIYDLTKKNYPTALTLANQAKLEAKKVLGTENDDFLLSENSKKNLVSDYGSGADSMSRILLLSTVDGATNNLNCSVANSGESNSPSYQLFMAASAIYLAFEVKHIEDFQKNTKDIEDAKKAKESGEASNEQIDAIKRAYNMKQELVDASEIRKSSKAALLEMFRWVEIVAQQEALAKQGRVQAAIIQIEKAKKWKIASGVLTGFASGMILLFLWNPYAQAFWGGVLVWSAVTLDKSIKDGKKYSAEKRKAQSHTHLNCATKNLTSFIDISNSKFRYYAIKFIKSILPISSANAETETGLGLHDESSEYKYYQEAKKISLNGDSKNESVRGMVTNMQTPEGRANFSAYIVALASKNVTSMNTAINQSKTEVQQIKNLILEMESKLDPNATKQALGGSQQATPQILEPDDSNSACTEKSCEFEGLGSIATQLKSMKLGSISPSKVSGVSSATAATMGISEKSAFKNKNSLSKEKDIIEKVNKKLGIINSSNIGNKMLAATKLTLAKKTAKLSSSNPKIAKINSEASGEQNTFIVNQKDNDKKKAKESTLKSYSLSTIDNVKELKGVNGISDELDFDSSASEGQNVKSGVQTDAQKYAEEYATMLAQKRNRVSKDSASNEINEDREISLFSIISNRYVKTALPTFFRKKQSEGIGNTIR